MADERIGVGDLFHEKHGASVRALFGGSSSKSLADYGITEKHLAIANGIAERQSASVRAFNSALGPSAGESLAMLRNAVGPMYANPTSLAGIDKLVAPWMRPVEGEPLSTAPGVVDAPFVPVSAPSRREESRIERMRGLGWWLPDVSEVQREGLKFAASLLAVRYAWVYSDGEGLGLSILLAYLAFLDFSAAIKRGK
jgi:hypothetical protein